METNGILKLNSYEVVVRGVYGRNRTEKFQILKLRKVPVTEIQPDESEVRAWAAAALADLKLKRGRWTVVSRPIEREGIWERTILMSETPLFGGVV